MPATQPFVLRIVPRGCADNFYALGDGEPSSMALLQNLVPAPDSAAQWVPRPAAVKLPNSDGTLPGGFATGRVSCMLVIGSRVFGMMASNRVAGFDEPFCYDLNASAYVTITGITSGNVPASPAATGSWTPPHMELIGTKIIITHPGYSGTGSNFFGVINIINPSALTYSANNTATNALPVVPIWVTNFYGRAIYYCNIPNGQPGLLLSDVLDPLTRSNASAAYTYTLDDNIPLLCGGVFSVSTQLGGQTQALFVFKSGAGQIYQIKGDPALAQAPVTINKLNVATGTFAPNSVTSSPLGLMFISPDGLRVINFDGQVSTPIGANGTGKVFPWVTAAETSRIVASSNGLLIRISSNNAALPQSPRQEWVYDIARNLWHGPHTFPVHLLSHYGSEAIIAPDDINGLWRQSMLPSAVSTYLENGAEYECVYQTAFLPERAGIKELALIRAVLYKAFGTTPTALNISALNTKGNVAAFASLTNLGSITLWDNFVWGAANWLGSSEPLSPVEVPWQYPLPFDHVAIRISTQANAGLRFANLLLDIEELDYTVVSAT